MLQGNSAFEKKNFKEAERLYKIILDTNPLHPEATHNLGLVKKLTNKNLDAIKLFKKAVEINPKIEIFWLSYIDSLINNKKFETAKKFIYQAKKQKISSHKLNLLEKKLINKKKGGVQNSIYLAQALTKKFLEQIKKKQNYEAEKTAKTIVDKFPESHLGWKALGFIFDIMGRKIDSLNSYQKSIKIFPGDCEIHNNIGAILFDLKKYEQARISFEEAIKLNPRYDKGYLNLGHALLQLKKFGEAEKIFKEVIKVKPDFAKAHEGLGAALMFLGKFEETETVLRNALKLEPNLKDSFTNLCELLEKQNRLDDILLLINEASEKLVGQNTDLILFFKVLISFRKENYNYAQKFIFKINEDKLPKELKLQFLKLKAEFYDYKEEFDLAFKEFNELKKYTKKSSEYNEQAKDEWLNKIKENISEIKNLEKKTIYSSKIVAKWYQPSFIIGFPRSGTTLLDTILRSHSKINVIEELPLIPHLRVENELSKIHIVEKIESEFAENLSKIYFKKLNENSFFNKDKIIIDKLPFNLIHTSFIKSIFPQSKFILSIRHPFDCILSCWMQNFKINSAMANLIDLDRAVDTYCESMTLFKLSKKRYSLNTHIVRYEDLINNFETEVHKILNFLNLKWEDNLYNYQKTALDRKNINTPSYKQVIKKIYKTSAYRWKNYQKYLEPFRQKLQPWINEYGYLE